MQVLALNSSPRTGNNSKTELMLDHLVRGMREAGATVGVVNLREKTIHHCAGCFTCWTRTPGMCIHKDDMTRELLPKLRVADVVVYASPLYFHTINALMARFMERTLPMVEPFFIQNESGITYHPMRDPVPARVVLSVCGFPDYKEFDALAAFMESTRHPDTVHVANIFRPAAEMLSQSPFSKKSADILDATIQAGREIVSSMQVSDETMARVTQPLVDTHTFTTMGNLFWKSCIDLGVTPRSFREQKCVPRPDSLETFMVIMPHGINADAFPDRSVALQFRFSGDVRGDCHFLVENGAVEAREGMHPNPDVTIDTPFDTWMDILCGKADGTQLFMEQKYGVTGDIDAMIKLFEKER